MRGESSTTPSQGSTSAFRGAAADQQRSLEAQEHRANVLRLRLGILVACPIWFGFAALDYIVVHWMDAGRLWVLWGLRACIAPTLALCFAFLWRATPPSPRVVRALDIALYTHAALLVSVMAIEYGGLTSPYPPGIMMVIVARAGFSAESWRSGLVPNLLMATTFPLTVAVASIMSPVYAAQLSNPATLASGVQHLFFIYGTAILALAGSHFAWSLRRQLFRARSIGRYKLQHRVGSGGMGEVWAAFHGGLRRDVALKILKPESSNDALAIVRFEREVEAMTELSHPNTVRVFDYGVTEDGIWYYAMELLVGETIRELVKRDGALPPARAVHFALQAARSLAEAHARGIVHRDVKPANLFVTTAGGEPDFIKVLDFGIARRTETVEDLTAAGAIAGTPAYMAPEVLTGAAATPRSDVYGLGTVLYVMLAGRPPFEAEQETDRAYAQLLEAPVPPSEKRGEPLPPALEAIVMRCLEKDPAARYADAAELADALAPMAQQLPHSVRRTTPPPPLARPEAFGGNEDATVDAVSSVASKIAKTAAGPR